MTDGTTESEIFIDFPFGESAFNVILSIYITDSYITHTTFTQTALQHVLPRRYFCQHNRVFSN